VDHDGAPEEREWLREEAQVRVRVVAVGRRARCVRVDAAVLAGKIADLTVLREIAAARKILGDLQRWQGETGDQHMYVGARQHTSKTALTVEGIQMTESFGAARRSRLSLADAICVDVVAVIPEASRQQGKHNRLSPPSGRVLTDSCTARCR
jgi:hypothetical protein